MGAGLSKKQIGDRVRRRLKGLTCKHGGTVSQGVALNAKPNADGLCFAVRYRISQASNGETFGLPEIEIWSPKWPGMSRKYGGGLYATLESSMEAFLAEMNGKRVYVLVRRGQPGDIVRPEKVSPDLLPIRSAQIAAGNLPDVFLASDEGYGRVKLIHEIGFSSHEANGALEAAHGPRCFDAAITAQRGW